MLWLYLGLAGAVALMLALTTARVLMAAFTTVSSDRTADVAVVLGAAVRGDAPSPVFAGRIEHAVRLLEARVVEAIVLTGGRPAGAPVAESEVARQYARSLGVDDSRILVERHSTTTWTNLVEAAAVVEAAGYRSMLIVSDPLHMGRAMSMARTLALEAAPAPTARAGTRTPMGRLYMLAREVAALLRFSLLKTR